MYQYKNLRLCYFYVHPNSGAVFFSIRNSLKISEHIFFSLFGRFTRGMGTNPVLMKLKKNLYNFTTKEDKTTIIFLQKEKTRMIYPGSVQFMSTMFILFPKRSKNHLHSACRFNEIKMTCKYCQMQESAKQNIHVIHHTGSFII